MRKLALSNLSLLPGSVILGPKWAWNMALRAGFTALKVNPLRGWDIHMLEARHIDVVAFEYLWRPTFRASCKILWKRKDWMGFVADTCLIGYGEAHQRCTEYAWSSYASKAPGIDFPSGLSMSGHRPFARETECSPEKWLLPLDDDSLACLDTWHVRTYPNPDAIIGKLAEQSRIALIDIQTRDPAEWINWIRYPRRTDTTQLGHQLAMLRRLPESISASIEIAPQHLLRLMRSLSLSYEDTLSEIRQSARLALE